MSAPVNPRRVLLIGLDGATWDLLGPWSQAALLPNMTRLRAGGTSGVLWSTFPPFTAPAWTSMFTGVDPGKHGVFGFSRRCRGSYDEQLVNSSMVRVPKLWRLLNAADRRASIINVPLTYPPEPLNGFMVTGMMTPGNAESFSYPPELGQWLRRELGEYVIDVEVSLERDRDRLELLDELLCALELRRRATLVLMERDPDCHFVMVVFETLDRIQHLFWRYLVPGTRFYGTPMGTEVRRAVHTCCRCLDAAIGALVEAAGHDAAVLVASDHGFGDFQKTFYLNNWLAGHGFLAFKGVGRPTPIRRLMHAVDWRGVKRLLPRPFLRRVRHSMRGRIDWPRTRAYAAPIHHQGIYINLRGREPQGIVEPGEEYRAVRNQIRRELADLRDPDTGQPIVNAVWYREELYDGPYTDEAPDLLPVIGDHGYEISDGIFAQGEFASREDRAYGYHRRDGMYVAFAPGVFEAGHRQDADITDVAPTILHLLGAAVPEYMDGHVLSECITAGYGRRNPIRYTADSASGAADECVLSSAEAALVEERLRGLGYL